MKYKSLELQDLDIIKPFYPMVKARTCDFTIGGMFMWRDYFRMEYTVEDGTFFSRLYDRSGNVYNNLPVSEDMDSSISRLIADEGTPLRFCTVPEIYLPGFMKLERHVTISEQSVFADYLYSAADLIQLKGKKFSGQRNLISQFRRNVDSWTFETIDRYSVEKVRDFFCNTYLPMSADGPFESEENKKVLEVLENFDTYRLIGGYLTADDAIVGFCINEIVGDTLFTHIEKADRRCKGAYQMLVNQGAIAFAQDSVSFINREEDMGDPGLRAAKESYHPMALLKKFIVEVD